MGGFRVIVPMHFEAVHEVVLVDQYLHQTFIVCVIQELLARCAHPKIFELDALTRRTRR